MGAVIPVAERFCGQSPRIALSGCSLLAEVSAIDCTKLPLNPSMQSRRRDYIEFCTAVVNQLLGTSALLKAEFDAAREIALLGRLGAVFIV
jgi:hypothetical protein